MYNKRKSILLIFVFLLAMVISSLSIFAALNDGSLVAYYNFDNATTPCLDVHTGAFNCSYIANTTNSTTGMKVGTGHIAFTGGGNLTLPNGVTLRLNATQNGTIVFWLNKTSVATFQDNILSLAVGGAFQLRSQQVSLNEHLTFDTSARSGGLDTNFTFENLYTMWVFSWNTSHQFTFRGNGSIEAGASQRVNQTSAVGSNIGTAGVINFGVNTVNNNERLTGFIDEIGIWNRTMLDQADLNELFNGGGGQPFSNFSGAAVVSPNLTIQARNSETAAVVNIFNATVNGTLIQTADGTLETNLSDAIINITIIANNFFNGTFINFNTTTNGTSLIANLTPFTNVSLYDRYDNGTLTNVNVTFNGTNYHSDAFGIVHLPIRGGVNINLTINRTSYFNQSVLNHNTTNDLNVSFFQVIVNFSAIQKYTGTNITTGVSFRTPLAITQNGSLFLKAETIAITFNATGFNSKTESFTFAAFDNRSYNISNVSNARVNISIRAALNNSFVNESVTEIQINDTDGSGITEYITTSTGSIFANLTSGRNYTFAVNNSDFAYSNQSSNITNNNTFINFLLFTTNSFNIQFLDENNNSLINNSNINISMVGSMMSLNRTTQNGTIFVDLITPDLYTFRFNGINNSFTYPERFFVFNLTNGSFNNLTLYLLRNASATTLTLTVNDENARAVETAYIYVQKYDLASNTYITREIITTNFEGEATTQIELNREFYKFLVFKGWANLKKETNPSYIFGTTLSIQIQLADSLLRNYDLKNNIVYTLTFNNVTNNFRFGYTDTANGFVQYCLKIQQITVNAESVINTSCSTSTSATILLPIYNTNNTNYKATAFVRTTTSGNDLILSGIVQEFKNTNRIGRIGFFIVMLVTLAFAFMGKFNLTTSIILLPVPMVLASLIGIIAIPLWASAGLLISAVIISIYLGRK